MPKKTNDVNKKDKLKNDVSLKGQETANTPKVKKTTTKRNSTSKKSTTKSKASQKATPPTKKAKKNSVTKKTVKTDILEYYDLPYRYNQTIIKILAQTPTTLFVYWDISDLDRNNYISKYGKDFFNTTIPVLIVHNKTKNYSFEIEVNDFANSWYFNVADANCQYTVELGRKKKPNTTIEIPNNYVYVTSSNNIEAPNDHILFEKDQKVIFFKNTKTNKTYSKDIVNLNFIHKIGQIYNTYEVYKKIYKNDELNNIQNPTSY